MQPPSVACVERGAASIKGGVEQLTLSHVGEDVCGGDARVGHPGDCRRGVAIETWAAF
jgi:hypothetical protein